MIKVNSIEELKDYIKAGKIRRKDHIILPDNKEYEFCGVMDSTPHKAKTIHHSFVLSEGVAEEWK